MIISSSFSCLLFHWRCFNVSLFRQCSIVVLRCSAVFRLFRRCSIAPVLFRCSGVVPLFSGCSMFRCSGVVPSFRRCSVFRRSVFRCSWFYSMPFEASSLTFNWEGLTTWFGSYYHSSQTNQETMWFIIIFIRKSLFITFAKFLSSTQLSSTQFMLRKLKVVHWRLCWL